jgi:hypothetical protein
LKIKGCNLPENWKIVDDPGLTPQQDNRVDGGVFVCYFMDFIFDGCKLDFNQTLISNGVWRDGIILLIDEYYKKVGPMMMTMMKLLKLRNPIEKRKKQNVLDQGNNNPKAQHLIKMHVK